VDAAREHDLKQSEVQRHVHGIRPAMAEKPSQRMEAAYEAQLKSHLEKIGELVLQIDVLKKAKQALSGEENSSTE